MPRTWFITGCSSGFGRHLAITAAQNGDKVVATSRDPSKLDDLRSLGVIPTKLDIHNETEIQAVIDHVESTIGPIDILVNNIGYILEGAIRILRAVLPSMRARKSGVVANFGSIGGWNGTPAAGFYCASKAAVAIYTESLAAELLPFNIDVTCVEPGYFRTDFLEGDHKIVASKRIPELDVSTRQTRDGLAAYSLRQPGDPVKGARVLFDAFTRTGRCEGRRLPVRLALGKDSLTAIERSLEREQEMLEGWREIIASTDCDDVRG
ncbi:dehydrogenase [Aspergillus oryzae 100-8]|uniref:Dehydrogenase with different specificitie n=1 Tax=Aspergillus oryzae (strain 3.042) TaxID=1160506 RepID=I8ABK4_ASPO3|nr:dehydrogenase with different specificitie [Aspergillus oryzae 3.042]KDE84348.1 dehydrogenase [Aspergillus oryzae 100-8]|eukprot:EIT82827.1 dehydrogenase with different specificitie [Aspergillus oryzae 3.042]